MKEAGDASITVGAAAACRGSGWGHVTRAPTQPERQGLLKAATQHCRC